MFTHYHDGNFPCTRPTATRRYIQFIKFIRENPGCTRREVMAAVFNCPEYLNPINPIMHQTEWLSILDAELCTKQRDGRKTLYFITEKGRRMLRAVGC